MRGHAPWSERYRDFYWSRRGDGESDPAEEKRAVFVQGNYLAERWAQLQPGQSFCIGEVGFGTGLNLLCCWQLWRELAPAGCRLHYLAFDLSPPHAGAVEQLHGGRAGLSQLTRMLLRCKLPRTGGIHRLFPDRTSERPLLLTLAIGDAAEQLGELLQHGPLSVNAWFLDAFAPARNPSGWSPELLHLCGHASADDATAATYSAAAAVKQALHAAGFAVQRLPGYGKKRHRLTARYTAAANLYTADADLYTAAAGTRKSTGTAPQSAVVVGGGLAGACCAYALAMRGCEILLLEGSERPGGGASANPAALLRPRFNPGTSPQQMHWYLSGWRLALEWLHQCPDWRPTGVLQYLPSERSRRRAEQLAAFRPQGDLLALKTASEASAIADTALAGEWLHYPQAGWVNAAAFCAHLTNSCAVKLRCNSPVAQVASGGNGHWRLLDRDGEVLGETSCCVLATGGADSLQLPPGIALPPLAVSTGEMRQVAACDQTADLRLPLCGAGTLFPPGQGLHWMSAGRSGRAPAAFFADPKLRLDTVADGQSYAARRWKTPTRLPSVGELAPGLYSAWGMGSRGLTLAPLAAEYLASELFAEPSAVGGPPPTKPPIKLSAD